MKAALTVQFLERKEMSMRLEGRVERLENDLGFTRSKPIKMGVQCDLNKVLIALRLVRGKIGEAR